MVRSVRGPSSVSGDSRERKSRFFLLHVRGGDLRSGDSRATDTSLRVAKAPGGSRGGLGPFVCAMVTRGAGPTRVRRAWKCPRQTPLGARGTRAARALVGALRLGGGRGDRGAGCQSWGATWTSLLQNDLPGQASVIGGLFPPWSLDVTAGKNLTIKQMQGREMIMFWILRKWSPWQQGARERTSFSMDGVGS